MIKIDMEMPIRCDDCNFAVEDKSGELICVAYDESVEVYEEKIPWKPKEGEYYYCILHNGSVDVHKWKLNWYNYYCYNSGNCFRTKKEITPEIKQRILNEMKGKYEND